MNKITNEPQYLGNIRDDKKYQEGTSSREDRLRNRKPVIGIDEKVISRVEDREATRALHRLHARLGFDLPGENPRRRHDMEDLNLRNKHGNK